MAGRLKSRKPMLRSSQPDIVDCKFLFARLERIFCEPVGPFARTFSVAWVRMSTLTLSCHCLSISQLKSRFQAASRHV